MSYGTWERDNFLFRWSWVDPSNEMIKCSANKGYIQKYLYHASMSHANDHYFDSNDYKFTRWILSKYVEEIICCIWKYIIYLLVWVSLRNGCCMCPHAWGIFEEKCNSWRRCQIDAWVFDQMREFQLWVEIVSLLAFNDEEMARPWVKGLDTIGWT